LNIMGNFSAMTRIERNWIKRASPFYAWIRHQTQAAMRLHISSPIRQAWMYSLYPMLTDQTMGEGELALFGQSFDIGGMTINMAPANPLATVFDMVANPTDPQNVLRSFAPGVKVPFQKVTGFDLGRMRMESSPQDLKEGDYFGISRDQSTLTRAISDPLKAFGEVGYSVLGTTRQGRSLRDVFYGTDFRYSTGDRGGDGQWDRDISLVTRISDALGSPLVPRDQAEKRAQVQKEDRDRQRRENRRR